MRQIITGLIAALICVGANAQDTMTPDELNASRGVNFATAEIRTETIASGLHVLFGVGGNVLASIGSQGVFVVDDQFSGMVPKIRSTIRELGGGEPDFVINTHWHFDHAEGNLALGPRGTILVAHSNARANMATDDDDDNYYYDYDNDYYYRDNYNKNQSYWESHSRY